MEFEFLKESIKNCIEIRKNLWVALLGLIGGLFALSITTIIIIQIKTIFFLIGVFFVAIILFAIDLLNQQINRFLLKIRELK